MKLVPGCNYHTTWQKDKAMRFVLAYVEKDWAILFTRGTRKLFWCRVKDLIFIETKYNIEKGVKILEPG
jgi:hypothetical protein